MTAWRRWQQAVQALDEAEEPEDFQSVGMRCRECLVAMVRTRGLPAMVPDGTNPPKRADVVGWCDLIADHVAHGSSAERVRGYLKAVSKAGWDLVNWLTHAHGATLADGLIAHELTEHILVLFGAAMLRHRQSVPDRCESCGLYHFESWADEPGIPIEATLPLLRVDEARRGIRRTPFVMICLGGSVVFGGRRPSGRRGGTRGAHRVERAASRVAGSR
jgi:hypothetical protein